MLLSIVTIAFNNPKGLQQTLESLRPAYAEFGSKLEHIIVDSSPEAHNAVRESFATQSQIRWLSSKLEGIYAAINLGTREAKGNIIWHLHAGDMFIAGKSLKEPVVQLAFAEADLLISDVNLSRDQKFMFTHRHSHSFKRNLLGLSTVHHQGVLFKRGVFEKVGFFNESLKLSGDYEFFIRLYKSNAVVSWFENPFVQYDTQGRSLSEFDGVYAESMALAKTMRLNLVESMIANSRLCYHWLRVKVVSPALNKIGLYSFCTKFYYGLRRLCSI